MNARIRIFISLIIVLICMSYVSPVQSFHPVLYAIRVNVLKPPADLELFLKLPAYTDPIPLIADEKPGYWRMEFSVRYPTDAEESMKTLEGAELIVKTNNKELMIPIELKADLHPYVTPYYSLDLTERTLQYGLPVWFEVARFTVFVVFTLLVKCFLFYLYSYREKKSWLIFVLTNAILLIILSIFNYGPENPGGTFMSLIGAVYYGVPAETVVYIANFKEKSKIKAFTLALLSNAILVGSVILSIYINLLD